jgi:formylmethanofuran dehydrogenase subunit B
LTTGQALSNVVCPFCALHCDDLTLQALTPVSTSTSCPRALAGYERVAKLTRSTAQPAIDGQPVTLQQAIDKAVELLGAAQFPAIVAATDVDGARAAIELAQQCGGVIEHPDSTALLRTLDVMQHQGWLSTSLSEARNRADLFVIFGENIFELYPRLNERVLQPPQKLFEGSRSSVLIGPQHIPADAPADASIIPAGAAQFGMLAGTLRALLRNAPVSAGNNIDIDIDHLKDLAERLKTAAYPVIVWAAQEFAFPHAELALQNLISLVRELSAHNRCVALALAGGNGDISAVQVNSWRCGFPLRTAFNRGYPDYDPYHYDYQKLLASGEADVLVWLDGFGNGRKPPAVTQPSIVLGYPGISFDQPPAVYIPIGLAGIDHAGQLFRTDSVALRLQQLRPSSWPHAAGVLGQIRENLP